MCIISAANRTGAKISANLLTACCRSNLGEFALVSARLITAAFGPDLNACSLNARSQSGIFLLLTAVFSVAAPHPRYQEPYPIAASKKGLQVEIVDDALALGVKHA